MQRRHDLTYRLGCILLLHLLLQAAAAVPPHLQGEKDPLLRQLAPLHISRDYLYQATERTSSRAVTTGAAAQQRPPACSMGGTHALVCLSATPTFPDKHAKFDLQQTHATHHSRSSHQGVFLCVFLGLAGRHSTLALALTTVPVFPKDAMTPFWHRPRR